MKLFVALLLVLPFAQAPQESFVTIALHDMGNEETMTVIEISTDAPKCDRAIVTAFYSYRTILSGTTLTLSKERTEPCIKGVGIASVIIPGKPSDVVYVDVALVTEVYNQRRTF